MPGLGCGDPAHRTLVNCEAPWMRWTVGPLAIQCGWNQAHEIQNGRGVFPTLPIQSRPHITQSSG